MVLVTLALVANIKQKITVDRYEKVPLEPHLWFSVTDGWPTLTARSTRFPLHSVFCCLAAKEAGRYSNVISQFVYVAQLLLEAVDSSLPVQCVTPSTL